MKITSITRTNTFKSGKWHYKTQATFEDGKARISYGAKEPITWTMFCDEAIKNGKVHQTKNDHQIVTTYAA